MTIVELVAEPRGTGKKSVKAVRRTGHVPCVLYGRSEETIPFQIDAKDLHGLVYTDEFHRLSLKLDGKTYDCILKDVDFHPVSDNPIHADFQLLHKGEKIQLTVPVQFVGKAKGQLEGGEVVFNVHEIEILCLPKDIPEHVEVDISALEIGDTLHVSDLGEMSFEVVTPGNQSVVTVVARRVQEEVVELEEEGELAEGVEAEEGAAPAEGEGAKESSGD